MTAAVQGPTSLDARMIQAAQQGVQNKRQSRRLEKERERTGRQAAKKLVEWLSVIEATEAAPIMRAIAKAEKVSGNRLVLRVGGFFVLSSRGFRIADEHAPGPDLTPCYTTFRLRNGRDWWFCVDTKKVEQRVRIFLKQPNLEKDLVYQGVDEWPTAGKICFWGAFAGCFPLAMAFCASQHAAYNRAFKPAV